MAGERTPLGFGRALRLGAGTALGLWQSVVAVFAAGTLRNLMASAATLGALVALARGGHTGLFAMIGALLVFFAIAQLLRAVALGGGLSQGAARMTGGQVPSFASAAFVAAPRSVSYALWTFAIELLRGMWQALAIGLSLVAFFTALSHGHGVGQALLLALALTLAIPLGIAITLWTELAFTRAIALGQGYLVALYDAAAALWLRPLAPLGLILLTGVFAFAFRATISVAGGVPTSGRTMLALLAAGSVISSALTAFVEAALQLIRLQAFLALTLDSEGRLPAAPEPPPTAIPIAEVLPSEGPIVEGRPLPS